ncbi:MAG: hypothetical protein QXR39_08735 [Candidatus Methanomethylicia archaeon]
MEEKKEEKKSNQEEKGSKERKKEVSKQGLGFFDYLKIVLLNMIVTLGVLYIYHMKFVPKLVFADFSFYINGLKNLYVSGKINDAQLRSSLEEAVKLFNEEAKKGKYVFLSDVILNPPDTIPRIPLKKDIVDAGKVGVQPFSLGSQQSTNSTR